MVRSSGADSPRVPGGQSACSPRTVHFSGFATGGSVGFNGQSAIQAGRFVVPVWTVRGKDIEVRYHFLRDNVEKGKIALIHVRTHDQLADIFTKPLDQTTFTRLRGELGVCLIS
jgi:hypothetical protein